MPLVATVLAWVVLQQPGRNLGENEDTTRHLSGRSVRVLAFHLRRVYGQVGLTVRAFNNPAGSVKPTVAEMESKEVLSG
jgi:hypothetical protein